MISKICIIRTTLLWRRYKVKLLIYDVINIKSDTFKKPFQVVETYVRIIEYLKLNSNNHSSLQPLQQTLQICVKLWNIIESLIRIRYLREIQMEFSAWMNSFTRWCFARKAHWFDIIWAPKIVESETNYKRLNHTNFQVFQFKLKALGALGSSMIEIEGYEKESNLNLESNILELNHFPSVFKLFNQYLVQSFLRAFIENEKILLCNCFGKNFNTEIENY